MKRLLLLCSFFFISLKTVSQSTIILPNGIVIPSYTLANRPVSATTGQLIYQTDGTSGLYLWNGTQWTAVATNNGSGGGTVTTVNVNAPLSVTNASTTPSISLNQATGSSNGFLSSADWITFNDKFSLPNLSSGSLLFSNGSTISQKNTHLFWNNTDNRLGVGTNSPSKTLDISGVGGLRVNSTNSGGGDADWVSANFGGTSGSRVVAGLLYGKATIGAHGNDLMSWADFHINPYGGNVGIGQPSPTEKLDVGGKTKTTTLQVTNGASNGYILRGDANGNATWVKPDTIGNWRASGQNQYAVPTGNVGIGTTTPNYKLDIQGTGIIQGGIRSTDSHTSFISASPLLKTNYTEIAYLDGTLAKPHWQIGKTDSTSDDFKIKRFINDGSTTGESISISKDNGTVIIGNDNPSSIANTLSVNGSVALKTKVFNSDPNYYQLSGKDHVIIVKGTGGTSLYVPNAVTCLGRVYIFINHSSTSLGLQGYGYYTDSSTITNSVAAGTTVQIISDGIYWRKMN